VLFDQAFIGGTTLQGRCTGNCGAFLKSSEVLNLTVGGAARGTSFSIPAPTLAPQPSVWLKGETVEHLKTKVAPQVRTPRAAPLELGASAASAALSGVMQKGNQKSALKASCTPAPQHLPVQPTCTPAPQHLPAQPIIDTKTSPSLGPAPHVSNGKGADMEAGMQHLAMDPSEGARVGEPREVEEPAQMWMRLAAIHQQQAAKLGGWEVPSFGSSSLKNCENGNNLKTSTKNSKQDKKSKQQGPSGQPRNIAVADLFAAAAVSDQNLPQAELSNQVVPKQSIEITETDSKTKKRDKVKTVSILPTTLSNANPTTDIGPSELEFWAMLSKS